MRALDTHMSAAIDVERRIVLVTGSIDSNEHTIVLNVPLPCAGEWTLIKAEVNITDQPWCGWQITLGDGITVPTVDDVPELLVSQNFAHTRYLPEHNTVWFYGEGEVRPGETLLKYAKFHTTTMRFTLSHNRVLPGAKADIPDLIQHGEFGATRPKLEVVTPVHQILAPDMVRKLHV